MPAVYCFERGFKTFFPQREDWINNRPPQEGDIVIHTDSSKIDHGSNMLNIARSTEKRPKIALWYIIVPVSYVNVPNIHISDEYFESHYATRQIQFKFQGEAERTEI